MREHIQNGSHTDTASENYSGPLHELLSELQGIRQDNQALIELLREIHRDAQRNQPPPVAVGLSGLARMAGFSTATANRLKASGELGPRPIRKNGRILYSVAEIRSWVEEGMPCRATWEARKAASRAS